MTDDPRRAFLTDAINDVRAKRAARLASKRDTATVLHTCSRPQHVIQQAIDVNAEQINMLYMKDRWHPGDYLAMAAMRRKQKWLNAEYDQSFSRFRDGRCVHSGPTYVVTEEDRDKEITMEVWGVNTCQDING